MKTKKNNGKFKSLTMLALSILLLTSCNSGNNTKNESADMPPKDEEIPKRIEQELSSGVLVNADVEIPESVKSTSPKQYEAGFQEIDVDKLQQILMPDEEMEKVEERAFEFDGEKKGNGIEKTYLSKSGKELHTVENISTGYGVPEYKNIEMPSLAYRPSVAQDKEKGASSLDYDFPFETRENVKKKIDELLSTLKVKVSKNYQSYALDYEQLKGYNSIPIEDEEMYEKDFLEQIKNIQWNETLNTYLFEFQQEVDGIPVTRIQRLVKGRTLIPPVVSMAYSQAGIVQLSIYYLYLPSKVTNDSNIIGLNKALELLDTKYNSIILSGEHTVQKIRLEYVPEYDSNTKGYELIPVYNFDMIQKGTTQNKETNEEEMMEIPSNVLFNAIDGTEMLTGGGDA